MKLFNKPNWLKPEINEPKYWLHVLVLIDVSNEGEGYIIETQSVTLPECEGQPDGTACSIGTCLSGYCTAGGGTGGGDTEYCGDYICNNAETCSTCPSDCGQCSSTSSSSSSSSSSTPLIIGVIVFAFLMIMRRQ